MRPSLIGPLSAIGAAVLYGTSWVATGIALSGFSPFGLAVARSIITVLLLIPVVAWVTHGDAAVQSTAPTAPRSGRFLRILILGLLGGALFGIGMNVSIALNGAAITAFIAGAYPVIAAAGAPLILGERIRRPAIVGLLLAFVGTLLVAGFDVSGVNVAGVLVAGSTSVVTGLFLLLGRRWQRPWGIRPTQITLSNFAMLGIAGVLLGVATGDQWVKSAVPADAWLSVLWLGVAAGAVATVLLGESLRRLPASESSAYLMLNPLTGALLAIPVLGESLSPPQIAGAALILAGIGLATGTFVMLGRMARGRRGRGGGGGGESYSTTVTHGS